MEERIYQSVAGNISDAHFIGVKLGDVNGDWAPMVGGSTLAALPSGARAGQPMADASLGFGALQRANDGSLTLPVYAMANEPLLGVQFELNWDDAVMALDHISSTRLPGFSPEFHASVGEGTAKLAWDDAVLQGVELDGTEPLLTLHFSRLSEGATGLELEAPVLAGEQGSLGWVQPASVYLKPDDTSQLAYGGSIKVIEVQGNELRLLVDTQTGQSYQLQSTGQLAQPAWQTLMELEGSDTWQEVVLPADSARAYLRLVPVDGVVR